jgi:hypothetical protein
MHTKLADIPSAVAVTTTAYEVHLRHYGWQAGKTGGAAAAVTMALEVAATSLQHRLPMDRARAMLEEGVPHLDVVADWKLVYKSKVRACVRACGGRSATTPAQRATLNAPCSTHHTPSRPPDAALVHPYGSRPP